MCVYIYIHIYIYIYIYNNTLIVLLIMVVVTNPADVSLDENIKSEHVIGNCFLRIAISVAALPFPTAPGFLLILCWGM